MIVGLNGNATSGKDTAALVLIERGWTRLAFADVLKGLARHLGWNGQKDEAGRKFLEDLGAGVRLHINPAAWVWPIHDILVEAQPGENFVITDMRYLNEAEMIRRMGGLTGYISRPGVGPGGPSDEVLARAGWSFDFHVHNTGTIEQLHRHFLDSLHAAGAFSC